MERALSLLATAALATALTTTLVAALSTASGRGARLHLATAGRRRVLLHLAAIFDFSAAGFRSRYRRAAANGGAALDVLARAFDRSANRCAAAAITPLGRS